MEYFHSSDCLCGFCHWRLGQYAGGYLSPPQPSFTLNHVTDTVIIQRLESIEKTLAEIEKRLYKKCDHFFDIADNGRGQIVCRCKYCGQEGANG